MQTPIKDKISVIIPVYNQEKTIADNIHAIQQKLQSIENKEFEIILVDDGSTDDTFFTMESAARQYNNMTMIMKVKNEGKGAAFLKGYCKATGDYIVLMDSDLQIDLLDLMSFFNIMDMYRAPVVTGNKRHKYSYTHYSLLRQIVSFSYNIMCRVLFGFSLRDTQCGMKLFKKWALDKVYPKLLVKRFAFDLELLMAFRENYIRIADAPVYVEEQRGKGSVNVGNIIDTARDTLAVWYRVKKGWYKC